MAQIIGHSTSHFAWTSLEKIFASSSQGRVMQLRLELQTMKKGSMSMIDYLMKIKGIANSLAAIGEPLCKTWSRLQCFCTINTRDDRISLETVQSMLLSYEQRLEQQKSIA